MSDFAFGGSAFGVAVLLLWSLVVNFHFFTSQLAWLLLPLIFLLQETEDPLSWGISSIQTLKTQAAYKKG